MQPSLKSLPSPRRLFALLATAALLFTVLPGSASADHVEILSGDGLVTSVRWNGETRYDTASKLAVEGTAASISTPATSAVLATGENFPDALAGSFLSGVVDGPILLTRRDAIPAETLGRLTGDEATALTAVDTVYLLGGPEAIAPSVETQLSNLGLTVVRIAGATRFETAAAIATQAPDATVGTVDGLSTAILATADNFPDALVAGAAASNAQLPLLLTDVDALPRATVQALADLEVEQVVIAGGPVAVSADIETSLSDLGYQVRRIAGSTRDGTAAAFAQFNVDELDFSTTAIGLTRNDDFADALSFAPFAGREALSIVLTRPAVLPPVTATYLVSLASCQFDTLYIPGGPVAVSAATETAARRALTARDCDGIDNLAPAMASATIVQSGADDSARARPAPGDDVLRVTYTESVTCAGDVAQQFTFLDGAGIATAATSLDCNGTSRVLLGFPAGTLGEGDDATLTYVRAGDPSARVYDLLGNEAVNNDVIDTIVSAVPAEVLTVNSTDDQVDDQPGDGICETSDEGECSLRAAIMEANSNANLTQIDVPGGTYTVTRAGRGEDVGVTGDLDISADLVLVGTGDAGATVIDGNRRDRVLDVRGAITVSFENLTITGGNANGDTERGGGLRAIDATVSITDTTVVDNTARQAGGGVENTGGVMTVTNSTLAENRTGDTPGNGGGLHAAGGSTDLVGSTVSGNEGVEGGGLWIGGGGTMTVSDTLVDDNRALGATADAEDRKGGGGVYNDGATLTITDSTVSDNTATDGAGSGGGVLTTAGGMVTLSDTTVSNNTADRAGGGIENDGSTLILDGTNTIRRNTATGTNSAGNGGGIHALGATTLGADIVDQNSAVEGGGLWIGGAQSLTLSGTQVTANTANAEAIGQGGGGVYVDGAEAALVATDALFQDNVATGSADSSGGGVILLDGAATITDSTFTGNTALRAGGGIEVTGTPAVSTLTLTDTDFTDNSTGASPGNGGAIHVSDALSVDVTGGTVQGNTADREGGGFWNQAGTTMTVSGTDFTDNVASGPAADDGGGAIFNNGGVLDVAAGTYTGNTALVGEGSGGAIHSTAGEVTVDGATFTDNDAARAGGAIEINTGSLTVGAMTPANFDGNDATTGDGTAAGNGGAIHGGGGTTLTIAGGTFDRNTADEGGGVWGAGTTTINGSTFTNNSALSNGDVAGPGGGALFNQGGTMDVDDAIIGTTGNGNHADGNAGNGDAPGSGGGIFSTGGTLTVDGSSFDDNTADRAGGAIEIANVDPAATPTINATDFTNNSANANVTTAAGNGGAIHTTNQPITISDGVVRANTAVEGGGFWNGTALMTITRTNFTANVATGAEATNGGGAVFNNGGDLTVLQGLYSFNTAIVGQGSGGAIHLAAGTSPTVTLFNVGVNDNRAARAGGGVESVATTLTITASQFGGNDVAGGANPGNGGGIHQAGGTSTITTNTDFFINTAVEGGGVWVGGGGTMNLGDGELGEVTFINNRAERGGAIYNNGGDDAASATTLHLDSVTAVGGNEALGGLDGDVYAEETAFAVTDATAGGNDFQSTGTVGLTCLTDDGLPLGGEPPNTDDDDSCFAAAAGTTFVVNVTTDEVDANPADEVCETATAGQCTLRAAVMQANADAAADAIEFADALGPIVLTTGGAGDTDAATGDLDITNPVTITGGGDVTVDGAGLGDRILDVIGAEVTITGITLDGGTATATPDDRGGALRLDAGSDVTITTSLVTNNSAAQAGGGLENGGGVLTVQDTDFRGNDGGTTTGNGGAIHAAGGTTDVTNGTVDGNVADEGGGFWSSGVLTVTDVTFTDNAASSVVDGLGGGALFNQAGTLDVNGGAIGLPGQGNHADGGAVSGSGGGIFSNGGTLTVDDTTFDDNTADRAGGAIEIGGTVAASPVIENAVFTNNRATAAVTTAAGNGGAIHTTDQPIFIRGGSATGNTAVEGGAFWNGTARMDIRVVDFADNVATGTDATNGGGAVFNNGGRLDIVSGRYDRNTANNGAGSGGAIHLATGASPVVTITNISILASSAARAGGAIESVDTDLTVRDSGFLFNDVRTLAAPGNGGAVHQSGGTSLFTNASFFINQAVEGGGVWVGGGGTMTLGDGNSPITFENNVADIGGAIYNDGATDPTLATTVSLEGVTATVGNEALGDLDGDVYAEENEFAVTNASAGNNNFQSTATAGLSCLTDDGIPIGDEPPNTDDDDSCFADVP